MSSAQGAHCTGAWAPLAWAASTSYPWAPPPVGEAGTAELAGRPSHPEAGSGGAVGRAWPPAPFAGERSRGRGTAEDLSGGFTVPKSCLALRRQASGDRPTSEATSSQVPALYLEPVQKHAFLSSERHSAKSSAALHGSGLPKLLTDWPRALHGSDE